MKGSAAKILTVSLILIALATLAFALANRSSQRSQSRTGLPTDWTHRHVKFSRPRTAEQAARLQNNTRYVQQLARDNMVAAQPVTSEAAETTPSISRERHKRRGRRLHRDWAMDMGPSALLGPNVYPAKYSFSATIANCAFGLPTPDFVIYPTGAPGASGQPSIEAYTNLYSGCSGLVPAVYWAFNTGGTVNTSPVISLTGTQVAFTQTSGGTSSLVLLTWLAFDGLAQTPVTLTPVAAGSYFGCAAPCMTTLPLGATDSNSSVFYDYDTDTAYVGDDSGKLHQFSPVFNGTPAEVTSGWPAEVSSAVLTSPLYDDASGNAFVADAGGFLYSVNGAGTITASSRLGLGPGIVDSPMLDENAGLVYVFAADDARSFAGIFQLPTTFAFGATGSEVTIGTGTATTPPVYDGDFDYGYITSFTATGNLYVCGNPGGEPTLYQVPVTAGTMGAARSVSVASTTFAAACSPLTDVYNPTISGEGTPTEWVFLSTEAAGSPPPCGGFSCVMNFKTTSWYPSTVYNLGQEILDSNLNIQVAYNSGGTSGTTAPTWSTTTFAPTADGGVIWRMQGSLKPPFPPAWAKNTVYDGGAEIYDSNNNIELTLFPGVSGGSQPAWSTTPFDTTIDGTVIWFNMGLNPVAALQESGGTSGIIIDNTVDSAGASQVYFSTLQEELCFTSGGTGGCAVQASQQALK